MLFKAYRFFNLARGWRDLLFNLRLVWRLLTDVRVPLTHKLVVPATFLYMVWPLDFLPDLLPFLGQVDDLTALFLAVSLFLRLAPARVVAEHRAELLGGRQPSAAERDGTVIEGECREVDDERP